MGKGSAVSYSKDRKLETRFTPQIKTILGMYFVGQDVEADLKEGTDFMIMIVKPFRVGVRLRRWYYYCKEEYRRQFTLRWSRPSGVQTEIDKVRAGLVDYILYGFLDEKEERIIQYFIGNLRVFRENEPEPDVFPNYPPDSELSAYNVRDLPKDFVEVYFNEESNTCYVKD